MSVNFKMTAIADEIRELSGTTDKLGLDAMAASLSGSNDVVADQADLITNIKAALVGKASGGGGGSNNYVKFNATPTSTTSITIENPLGGIAKCFAIRRLSDTAPSSQKVYECVGSYNPPLGAFEFASTTNTVRYPIQRTDGSIGNATFKITEGKIQVYRYNAANTWDTSAEYEIEIWQ